MMIEKEKSLKTREYSMNFKFVMENFAQIKQVVVGKVHFFDKMKVETVQPK